MTEERQRPYIIIRTMYVKIGEDEKAEIRVTDSNFADNQEMFHKLYTPTLVEAVSKLTLQEKKGLELKLTLDCKVVDD